MVVIIVRSLVCTIVVIILVPIRSFVSTMVVVVILMRPLISINQFVEMTFVCFGSDLLNLHCATLYVTMTFLITLTLK